MHNVIKIMKKVKIKNILILIMLLLFNTYAWFIYATRVATDVTAHVSSWNVEFIGSEGEITTNLEVSIGRIYPGMERFEKVVEVHNKGETKAKLDYQIEELKVMGEKFIVNETNGTTSQEIVNKMENEYPFKIRVEKDDLLLSEGTGSGKFIISLDWDFESEDENSDELDTLWGNKAYEFYSLNPGENSIEVKMTLIATQKEKQGN